MHEGHCCSRFGLPGSPAIAEELMVHRDIELARLTGARHPPAAPLDGGQRRARCAAPRRTAAGDVGGDPRRVSLTDELLAGYDFVRTRSTRLCARWPTSKRCAAGLADGTIDAIATDHAPHGARDRASTPRPGATGDARSRDRARGRRSPISTCPSSRSSPPCRRIRPPSPASPAPTAGRSHRASLRNITVFDPDHVLAGATAKLATEPQHPVRRVRVAGRVRHTVLLEQLWWSRGSHSINSPIEWSCNHRNDMQGGRRGDS